MTSLFESQTVNQLKTRMAKLGPTSERLWGTMTAAQALAHCAASMEWAVGDAVAPRMLLGRIIGWMVKPFLLGNDKPMRKNAKTVKSLIVKDQRDLGSERERLNRLIDRFATGGAEGCTKYPHSLFGRLTPQEWATLMYKNLDHHLRQFGV